MSKKDWIWMGHAGHFCAARSCRFHLSTYVNGYIASTVGEYFPDEVIRRVMLETKLIFCQDEEKEEKIKKTLKQNGDEFDITYLKNFGFDEIGADRLYETMVFKAVEGKYKCCPYEMEFGADNLDFEDYNTANEAFNGHYEMCEKWDKKSNES